MDGEVVTAGDGMREEGVERMEGDVVGRAVGGGTMAVAPVI